jgi:predicted peptidase
MAFMKRTLFVLLAGIPIFFLACETPPEPELWITGYKYHIMFPRNYAQQEKCPMILFLHGAGAGTDNINTVKGYGLGDYADAHEDFPFVVIAPQSRGGWEADLLYEVMEEALVYYKIDETRIYVTGFSMGGAGTFLMAIHYPDLFAAAAPVCGFGDPELAGSMKDVPCWIFHDEGDPAVPVEESKAMYDALEALGAEVKITLYHNNTHDAWHETYANPELYEWFLEHVKGG